jgi:hypothetical protein
MLAEAFEVYKEDCTKKTVYENKTRLPLKYFRPSRQVLQSSMSLSMLLRNNPTKYATESPQIGESVTCYSSKKMRSNAKNGNCTNWICK